MSARGCPATLFSRLRRPIPGVRIQGEGLLSPHHDAAARAGGATARRPCVQPYSSARQPSPSTFRHTGETRFRVSSRASCRSATGCQPCTNRASSHTAPLATPTTISQRLRRPIGPRLGRGLALMAQPVRLASGGEMRAAPCCRLRNRRLAAPDNAPMARGSSARAIAEQLHRATKPSLALRALRKAGGRRW